MAFGWAVTEFVKGLHSLPLCEDVHLRGLKSVVNTAVLWYCPPFRYDPVLYRGEGMNVEC